MSLSNFFRSYFFIICCLLASLNSNSQSPHFQFRFLDLPENFRSQFITLLDEDAAGMLWFVTNNGLHRYDGNQVLTFDMQSSPSLPDINVNQLFADSHNNLWIATRKNLVRFDLTKWKMTVVPFPESLSSNYRDAAVTAIAEGPDGLVYFGSGAGKLFSYASGSLHMIIQVPFLHNKSASFYPEIKTIRFTGNSNLWLSTDKGQLLSVSTLQPIHSVYFEIPAFEKTGINFLSFGSNRKCLLYADEAGAYLLDTISGLTTKLSPPLQLASLQKAATYPVAFSGEKVGFFFSGQDQNLKGFSIYDFETGSFNSLDAVYPLSFRSSIFRKLSFKNNTVYISTDHGIGTVNYVDNPFQIFLADLQNINSIRSIYKSGNGRLLVGSYKDKFTQVDESLNTSVNLSDLMISGLLPWRKDSLLAGIEGKSVVLYYRPSNNSFERVLQKNIFADISGIDHYVLCLRKENDTLVWVGTYSGALLVNVHTGQLEKNPITVPGNIMQQLNVTDIMKVDNNRFFCTHDGIFKINMITGTGGRLFGKIDSSSANAPYNCLAMVDGLLWAGSNGNGILIFDTTGIIHKKITTANGLASNIVFSLPVCKNFVVAGTSKGLSIIDKNTQHIQNYSSQRYLPSNEFNRAAFFVENDTVYMGTTNGLIRFTLPLTKENISENAAQIKVSSFSINNGDKTTVDNSVAYQDKLLLKIPAGTKSFSISLAGLNNTSGELNLYYRLGTDSTWQNIGQRREITFISLAPDQYDLQIAARFPDGQWTGKLLSIPIFVAPRFYQMIWFKILLVLICLTIIWLAIKYREKALRKEQELRSRIAGDLHDEVGSALTRIYFQADSLSANSDQPQLQKIASSSQQALSSMSDMVWSIDAHYDNATDLVSRMKDYSARLQDELECQCRFEIMGVYEKRHIAQVIRQNIFLIFKEAITNALKYGSDKQIDVKLVFEKHQLTLMIKNEVAVPEPIKNMSGGHGVKSMQLRADKIKAQLTINQEKNFFSIELTVKN